MFLSPTRFYCVIFAGLTAATLIAPDPVAAQSGFFTNAELNFLKYGRDAGSQVGDDVDDRVDFGFQTSPRITAGFLGCNGLGARMRYWQFDHRQSSNSNQGFISVRAETLDGEVFHRIRQSDLTIFELSGGVRYMEFDEILFDNSLFTGDTGRNQMNGLGGLVGAQVRRDLLVGTISLTGRYSICFADKQMVDSNDLPFELSDVPFSIGEVALRYEVSKQVGCGSLLLGLGVEWQKWSNFSAGYDLGDDTPTDFRGGGIDVGFFGFGTTLGYQF